MRILVEYVKVIKYKTEKKKCGGKFSERGCRTNTIESGGKCSSRQGLSIKVMWNFVNY